MIVLQMGNMYQIRSSRGKKIIILTDAETFSKLFKVFTYEELITISEYCKKINTKGCLILAYDCELPIKDQGQYVYRGSFYQRLLDEIKKRGKLVVDI